MNAKDIAEFAAEELRQMGTRAGEDAKPLAEKAFRCSHILARAAADAATGRLSSSALAEVADRLVVAVQVSAVVEAHRQYERRVADLVELGLAALKLVVASV